VFDDKKVFLGITPTCWTNDDFQGPEYGLGDDIDFETCVNQIAMAGFQGCSIGHKFPPDVDTLNQELQRRQLRVSEPWVSLYFTSEDPEDHDKTIKDFRERMGFVKAVGGQDIGVAELATAIHPDPKIPLKKKPVFTENEWDRLVKGLNLLGNEAAQEDMRLCYHPHMGTGVQTQSELSMLMDRTNDNVHLLLDTGHLTWAGGKPLKAIKDYGDRIAHVHLKNVREKVMTNPGLLKDGSFYQYVFAGIFTVPGDQGIVDFPPILQQLARNGYTGWLVVEAEQPTKPVPPLEYAKKARAYLREVAEL
jgi:inosose dehydratase